jgi:hypothetical protein
MSQIPHGGAPPAPERAAPAAEVPRAAWRLICEYAPDGVRVVSRRRLHKVLPPSAPIESTRQGAGFWLEVRDAREQPQYVRALRNPLQSEAEVAGEDGRIRRVSVAAARGAFALLVPEIEGSDHISLLERRSGVGVAGVARTGGTGGPAEVARLSLLSPDGPTGSAAEDPADGSAGGAP